MLIVGIDPGVETGFAIWKTSPPELMAVESWSILNAMRLLASIKADVGLVIVEDARKRKWYGHMDREQGKYGAGVREGVGSVKRDCAIWEEYLQGLGVPFEMRYPSGTKMKSGPFAQLTGWKSKSNEHGRDAAMIVFGLNESIARAKVIAFSDGRARERPADSRGLPRAAV
jgi:hypothetical protein